MTQSSSIKDTNRPELFLLHSSRPRFKRKTTFIQNMECQLSACQYYGPFFVPGSRAIPCASRVHWKRNTGNNYLSQNTGNYLSQNTGNYLSQNSKNVDQKYVGLPSNDWCTTMRVTYLLLASLIAFIYFSVAHQEYIYIYVTCVPVYIILSKMSSYKVSISLLRCQELSIHWFTLTK